MNTRIISIIFLSIMILSIATPLANIVSSTAATSTVKAISASATTTNTVYKFYKNQTFFFYLDYNVTKANITVFINGSSVVTLNDVAPKAKINFTVNSSGFLLVNGTTYGSSPLTVDNVYSILFMISNTTNGTTKYVKVGPYNYVYTPTKGTLTLDRKHYPAFNETVVHLVLDDWDKNWDPFTKESYLLNLTIKAYFLDGTNRSGWIILNFTEMGTNTSKFHNETKLNKLLEAVNLSVNPAVLKNISCFEIIYTDSEAGSTSSWIFDVFYTLGTIKISKPSFPHELNITVVDLDANLDSWAYDGDGVPLPHSRINVYVYYTDPETNVTYTIDYERAEEELNETGENTSVFTYIFPVTFNTTLESNITEDIYHNAVRPNSGRIASYNNGSLLIVPGSWLVVEYYDYNPANKTLTLVANKTIYPEFYNTSLIVTYNGIDYKSDFSAPTPIWFTFNMSFNDINLEDKQWNIVKDGPCPACPCYDWKLSKGENATIPVYAGFLAPGAPRLVGEIEILVNGVPATMNKSITVSICRVAFGQFKVTFKDEFLRIVPFNVSWLDPMPNYGDNLTIRWIDFIANKSSEITVRFPPAEISLTLDRKEYPILHSTETGNHDVVVHIRVKDTTSILESRVTAFVKVLSGAPSSCDEPEVLLSKSVTLGKVGEALFEGNTTISVNEKFLNAILLVEYTAGNGTLINATAEFKPHDGKIYIVEDTAVVNGTITIVLNEPDRNLDSKAYDTYTATLAVYVNNNVVRQVSVTLNETKPDSGVFNATVRLDDRIVYWVNKSQAPLTLSIANKISVNYVDGITSRARWVPGASACGPSGCPCSVDAAPDASGDSVKIKHHTARMYIFKVDPASGKIVGVPPFDNPNTSTNITETEEVLPVDRIRIIIVDPDLVFLGKWQTSFNETMDNMTREQAANSTLIVTVKATKDREERYLLETTYTIYNPKAESWGIPQEYLNRTDTFVSPPIDIVPLGCCEPAARKCFVEVYGPGDVIVVKYTDNFAKDYKKETISSTLKVVAEPPTIKISFMDEKGNYTKDITIMPEDFENAEYKVFDGSPAIIYKVNTPVILEPGYYMTVKICDDDALALYDVVTTSYPNGTNIWRLLNPYIGYEPTLTIRTDTDTTGVTKRAAELLVTKPPRYFLLQNFKFDNATVVFRKQDTLYIIFNDAFTLPPPAAAEAGVDYLRLYKVVIEIPLGAKPPAYPVVPNETGIEFKEVQVVPGTTSYVLDIPIFINGTATIPKLTVIAVIMKDGSVYDIRWTTYYNLAPGTTTVSADLGTNLEPGNYTVRILFWESLASMKPLSRMVATYSLTIE